jgi:arginine deiminase
MLNITEILPQYTRLNVLISEISESRTIEFEHQRFLADFHAQFCDILPFEAMLIELVAQAEAEQSGVLLQSLGREIQRNVQLISANKQTLENIDVKQVCEKFAK